jgi:hypothetical protein
MEFHMHQKLGYLNYGIRSNQYEHINQYIDIFQGLMTVMNDEKLDFIDYRPDKWEKAVCDDLEQFKNRLAQE